MLQAPTTQKSRKRAYSEITEVSSGSSKVVRDDTATTKPYKKPKLSFFSWVAQQAQNIIWSPFLSPAPTLRLPTPSLPVINPNHELLNRVAWAHGSSVATLIGAHFTENKLFPSGMLQQFTIDKGIVPFSGTFDGGSLLSGVNQLGLSGVTARTGYRFSDAWRYANNACSHVSRETLEKQYLLCLDKTYAACSNNALTEDKINQFSRTFAQLKSWAPQFLSRLSRKRGTTAEKALYRKFKAVLRHIDLQLNHYSNRFERMRDLLGDKTKLLLLTNKVIERYFAMTQDKHNRLVGTNRHGFTAQAKELLLDALYLEMRHLKLIFTKKHQPIVEKITYDANGLHSFGGWPTSALANGVTAINDITFETQYLAFLTGFIIHNAPDKLRSALGIPSDYVSTNTMYHHCTIEDELSRLEQKLKRHQAYITTCLQPEDNMHHYSDAEKALLSRKIPILYCASNMHSSMRPAEHELLWEASNGVPLGDENGIDILLTDTPENQAHIRRFLESEQISDVSVGIYEKEVIGNKKPK
tara:strand:- start:116137 stop:117717 length:1581 start_codon:yes stop_codon:yes gene_type:complete